MKVNRKGAHVRARSGYLIPGGREYVYSTKSAVELALESPWNFTELPFTVRSLKDSVQNDGKVRRSFEIRLGAGLMQVDDGHLQLEITAVALKQSGEEAAKTSEKIDKRLSYAELEMLRSSGVVLESHFDVVPGTYNAKFVVRDEATGAVGSCSTPLSVGSQ